VSVVSNAEKQYLLLVARRVYRGQQETKARGETYHDLSPYTTLSCGLRVRLVFRSIHEKVRPVVIFKGTPFLQNFSVEDLEEAATDIAGEPVSGPVLVADTLEFYNGDS